MISENRVPMTLRSSFFNDDFFRNAWDDFERVRQEMMRETREFWNRVERDAGGLMLNGQQSLPAVATTANNASSSSASASSSSNRVMQSQQQSSSSSMEKKSSETASSSNNDKRLAGFEDAGFSSPWFFPRRWMMPSIFGGDGDGFLEQPDFFSSPAMKSLDLFQHQDQQIVRMTDDDNKFELSLDTHDYRPDEIKVNVNGNTLSVEAKHEEKGDNKFVSRQFSRKYTLPEGCEAHKVNSNLSSDGILMITAPKKQAVKFEGSRAVPITKQ